MSNHSLLFFFSQLTVEKKSVRSPNFFQDNPCHRVKLGSVEQSFSKQGLTKTNFLTMRIHKAKSKGLLFSNRTTCNTRDLRKY
jgi:hypothetical protein